MGRVCGFGNQADPDADAARRCLFELGISTNIVGAKRHNEARAFSQALYETTDLDGIVYHSRLRKKTCMAIYDRAVTPGPSAQAMVQLERLAALVPALKALRTTLI